MPIEFACSNCNKRLRTPEQYAGRQTKCPNCGNSLTIPTPAAPQLPDELELELESIPAVRDPLAAAVGSVGPAAGTTLPPRMPTTESKVRAAKLDIADVFRTTWAIFKNQIGVCIGAVLLAGIISFAAQVAVAISLPSNDAQPPDATSALLRLVGSLVTLALGVWLNCGLTHLLLRVAKGDRDAAVSDLFNGGRWFLNYLGTSILLGLIVCAGLLALIVPGVVLALMLWPSLYLVVDKDAGVTEALSRAKEITAGNKLTMLLIYLVMVVAGAVVGLITLGVGMLVVWPFALLLLTVTYLRMTGQRTAEQRAA